MPHQQIGLTQIVIFLNRSRALLDVNKKISSLIFEGPTAVPTPMTTSLISAELTDNMIYLLHR